MLARLAPLYALLFAVCKNGVVPNLKLQSALINCHGTNPIYQGKENIHEWAPTAGNWMRMIALHFRDLLIFNDKYEALMRKAWGLEQVEIDWATLQYIYIYRMSLGIEGRRQMGGGDG